MIARDENVRKRVAGRAVAMTFDDGPDETWTPFVLDALDAAGASATFFVTPSRDPALVARIAAAGHEVGYHCGRHVRHAERSRSEVRAEARRDLTLLAEIGIDPRCWRPPWGVLADWTPGLAAELGLELWLWSSDTEDWSGAPAEAMLAGLAETVGPGSVVLMHDGIGPGSRRSGATETVLLVGPLVKLIRAAGLRPETIAAAPPLAAGVS